MSEPAAVGKVQAAQRVALLSGANRGIGAACARHLFETGWSLSLGMRKPVQPDWADSERVRVFPYEAAAANAERAWVDGTIDGFGRIDAVIASAGIMIPKSVIDADDADLDLMFEINVKAPRRLVRASWESLAASGAGRVIILASLSGKRVKSAMAGSYSISKFAAVALSHGIRQAGWDLGIRATAVCPGFVATDMARSITDRADALMTDPDDLARTIGMLLNLPNHASVAEFSINCQLEELY
ncbi:MAG: SDR family NAD(P)-dependent oxidoreductase [Mesorhizobium sp.]|uniref:SDR family NAD(P)-dependent oxidoreductase n=1 Tax=Mesorhizobium sp. TaxID=1871066 RepID=UPI0012145994|nr:SDR family NAD(P)-dependent oxidoreductase [Mesorhizobium sp.]TIS57113.1 MAG: SDR family NAD(P)-dependent oxidoreductase [Mesorhizobium sp.]TIS89352.1 MAG: SDR family NAD(P)-dependent oxidoreductase [Mesorhizobium sp.]TJW11833.1 MAG: SDR family NAD(P)-dependent oxidoreductase [Mesorhizobium sp.]TJW47353.1 MAG: SDR family NAD(P)-dependent oxidoreductase [Mesorhizobium sp.]